MSDHNQRRFAIYCMQQSGLATIASFEPRPLGSATPSLAMRFGHWLGN
ncbi:hypothetical protein [Paraburkholderia bannensis]|nr:hypothetical protein [Paraburkholderia bannensis]